MKLIFIILDGVPDRPCNEFNGLTPLEAANTPNLDKLAKQGKMGEIVIINEKIPPETDSAVLALFGYDPIIYNRGRGPLEAYGMGINFEEGDLVIRCNFATMLDDKIVDVRAGRISSEESKRLVDFVQENIELNTFFVDVKFVHTLNYRALLILHPKIGKLSDQISNTHPGYERLPGYMELPKEMVGEKKFEECVPLDNKRESKISATLINEFTEKSHELLENHQMNLERKQMGFNPANLLIMRGAGKSLPKLENFEEKYEHRWLCLGDTPGEKGIAKLLGMDTLKNLPDPKSDELSGNSTIEQIDEAVKNDMEIRVKELLKNFYNYDCFYLHIKGPDPFGHAGLPEKKKRVIEGIDKWFFEELLNNINLNETIVCVTSDHSTPCSLKAHSSDTVPVLISGGKIKSDPLDKFGESFCKKGSIKKIKATELINILMRDFHA